MPVLAALAILFVVQSSLIAAIVPRSPELAWPESEQLPPHPLVIPTLTITTNDVDPVSVLVLPYHTQSSAWVAPAMDSGSRVPASSVERTFSVKWAYSEEGARRVREFTEAHVGQRIQIRIGTFLTPSFLNAHPNRSGRGGMHGISEANAKAILIGLTGNEKRWWPR